MNLLRASGVIQIGAVLNILQTLQCFPSTWCSSLNLMSSIHFSRYAGFNMVKMRSRGGMPVAFADFEVSYGSGRKP